MGTELFFCHVRRVCYFSLLFSLFAFYCFDHTKSDDQNMLQDRYQSCRVCLLTRHLCYAFITVRLTSVAHVGWICLVCLCVCNTHIRTPFLCATHTKQSIDIHFILSHIVFIIFDVGHVFTRVCPKYITGEILGEAIGKIVFTSYEFNFDNSFFD